MVVCLRWSYYYIVSYYKYRSRESSVFCHFYCAVYVVWKIIWYIMTWRLYRSFTHYVISLSPVCEMLFKYTLFSSVWLRLIILSQLAYAQCMRLQDISLPIALLMAVKIMKIAILLLSYYHLQIENMNLKPLLMWVVCLAIFIGVFMVFDPKNITLKLFVTVTSSKLYHVFNKYSLFIWPNWL